MKGIKSVLALLLIAALGGGCASMQEKSSSPCASCVTDKEVTLEPINHPNHYKVK